METVVAALFAVVIRVVCVTLCVWGILAIFGVSLAFWPLVGLGVLVSAIVPATGSSN